MPKMLSMKFFITLCALVLSFGNDAKAAVVISFQDVSAAAGSTGTFDALLTNTGASDVNFAATNFTIRTPNPNVTFETVTTSTNTAPYIFPDSALGPDIDFLGEETQEISAGDADGTFGAPGVEIAPGETVALGNVQFVIFPTAVTETAELSYNTTFTTFSDASLALVSYTAETGTIDITAATTTATPEPSTTLPLTLVIASAAFVGIQRRRESASKPLSS